MKKIVLLLLIGFLPFLSVKSQEKLPINVKKSTIKWIGEYTFFFGGHNGYVNFKEGFFIKKGASIVGGEFVIDMNSMTNSDIKKQEGKDGLMNHLKEPDFFDVAKYPFAKLVITKVEYSSPEKARIEANLNLKGITKPINFYAEFDYKNKEMKTRFKINRRTWNVNYTSKFKDGAISDGIGFEVSVKI